MAHPFLKWAGGKTQLLPRFEALYPTAGDVDRYLEPFVGSGAVFFHVRTLLAPRTVVLADNNAELINVYEAIRDEVEGVIERLRRHKEAHSKDHYYRVRGQRPRSKVARAARVIYLNRTCFNGLYRVNSRGIFNVPLGRYENPRILDTENLRMVADALGSAELHVAHFRKTLDLARKGDFVYFDPPYHPLSETADFTSYTEGSFGAADQEQLAAVYANLDARGCRVMLSNSDTPFIRELYARFRIQTLMARRSINSNAERRGPVKEVVVLNYDPPDAACEVVTTATAQRSRSR